MKLAVEKADLEHLRKLGVRVSDLAVVLVNQDHNDRPVVAIIDPAASDYPAELLLEWAKKACLLDSLLDLLPLIQSLAQRRLYDPTLHDLRAAAGKIRAALSEPAWPTPAPRCDDL